MTSPAIVESKRRFRFAVGEGAEHPSLTASRQTGEQEVGLELTLIGCRAAGGAQEHLILDANGSGARCRADKEADGDEAEIHETRFVAFPGGEQSTTPNPPIRE